MTGVDNGLIGGALSADGLAMPGVLRQIAASGAVPRSARAWGVRAALAAGLLALVSSGVAQAATTTVNTLIDTDNLASTGCAVTTANGAVAGVEQLLSTTVTTDATGYRITGITPANVQQWHLRRSQHDRQRHHAAGARHGHQWRHGR